MEPFDIMMLVLIAKGVLAGLAIASPPFGPIAFLCVQRTISYGAPAGIATGLGAALADALFALLAALGLGAVVHLLSDYGLYVRLVGALFLLFIGWRTIRRPVVMPSIGVLGRHSLTTLLNDVISSFFITLINPFTIIAFLAVFTTLNVAELHYWYVPYVLALAAFTGSMLWWLLLIYGAGRFRHHLTEKSLRVVNIVSGSLIVLLAVITAGSVLVR